MKKIALAMIFVGLIIAFNSCAWRVPEHITVKSKADYSFSLGTYEKELNTTDNMDKDDLMGDSLPGSVKVYDYFPGRSGSTTQHYLLKAKIGEQTLLNTNAVEALNEDSYTIPNGTSDLSSGASEGYLGFNPSSILGAITSALGDNFNGKIRFDSVTAYFYCKAPEGLSAKVTIKNGSDPLVPAGTIIRNCDMSIFPETDGETVYTNLESSTTFIAQSSITNLINSTTSTDNLRFTYTITEAAGTITKANALAFGGIKFEIYAVLDIPLAFHVIAPSSNVNPNDIPNEVPVNDPNNIILDLLDMTGNSNSSSGNDSNNSEMTKYTEIIESVAIKYKALSLPFYSSL